MSTEKYDGDTARSDEETRYMQGVSSLGDAGRTMMMNAPQKSTVLAWLILIKGDPARIGTTFRLNENITSIGRAAENDIVLSDEAASTQHAKLRIEDSKFMLYDLVTTNGTKVNDKVIHNSTEIKENDEVQIGETILVFKQILKK